MFASGPLRRSYATGSSNQYGVMCKQFKLKSRRNKKGEANTCRPTVKLPFLDFNLV